MNWQPISTAPKDIPPPGANISMDRQQIIVGWAGSKHIAFACWEPDRDETGSWDQTGKGRWYVKHGPYAPPTHWMPLPPPPGSDDEFISIPG